MPKKLSDKEKLARVKQLLASALAKAEYHYKDRNVIQAITRELCLAFATIQADTDDDFLIENVTVQMWLRVNGVKQLEFPSEPNQRKEKK